MKTEIRPYNKQKFEDSARAKKLVVWVKLDLGLGRPEWIPVGLMK